MLEPTCTRPSDPEADAQSASPAAPPARPAGTLLGALAADPFYVTRHPLGAMRAAVNGGTRGRALLPGPRGLPGVGVWPWYARDPYGFVSQTARQYGDIFRLPLPVWDAVVLSHPDHVEHVLCDRDGRFSMIGPLRDLAERTGAALPLMEGERFQQRRKTLLPMFSRRNLADFAEIFVDEFVTRIDGWDRFADSGETVDLQHEIAQVTLPAFMRAMYSTSITEAEIAQVDVDIRQLMKSAASLTLARLPANPIPAPGVDSLPAAVVRLRRLVGRLIDDRLATPTEQPDLLNLLLQAREEDGSPLSRKDLVHELIVLMAGGYETVVASLSWTLALLCLNPEPAERLYAEIDELDGAAPTLEDLSRLTWAKACFDEGQRLQGAPLNFRFAMADDEIDGYPVRAGTLVGISMHTLHRDPRWWSQPDRYDPTRFADKDIVKARPKHAFIPFGAGPHHCIGSGMAYMNAQFLMTIVFQRYRLSTPPGWQPRHHFTFSTTIKDGLPVTLTRRSAGEAGNR